MTLYKGHLNTNIQDLTIILSVNLKLNQIKARKRNARGKENSQ